MADKVIENLITKLTFDYDDKQLEKFDKAIKSAVKGLTALVAGATASATAIFAFTKKVAESNDELGKFSQIVGVDVEALQELGYAAELNGGSIDSMNSSLSNLAKMASESARGVGAGVEVFGLLGLSVTDANGALRTADDLLFDVADAVAGLGSQAERLELTQKLGLGEDLLLSIQQGSEALRQQRKEARELGFVIDGDATKAAADFNDELLRVISIVKGVASAIGTRLMKQMTPIVEQFTKWFKINRVIIQQNISSFLDKLLKVQRSVFNITMRVVGVINGLAQAMGGWKTSIIAVSTLLLAMNASALLMPILAIAAGAGILLILEDFMKFAEGGDSVLGDMAEKSKTVELLLKGVLIILRSIRDGWVGIFTEGEEALDGLILMLRDFRVEIQKSMIGPLNRVIELFNRIVGVSISPVGADTREAAKEKTEGLGLMNVLSTIARLTPQGSAFNIARAGYKGAKSVINNTTNNSPNMTFNVTADNPRTFTQQVMQILSEQYSSAITNGQSQVGY